jgi:hypothetical protein
VRIDNGVFLVINVVIEALIENREDILKEEKRRRRRRKCCIVTVVVEALTEKVLFCLEKS